MGKRVPTSTNVPPALMTATLMPRGLTILGDSTAHATPDIVGMGKRVPTSTNVLPALMTATLMPRVLTILGDSTAHATPDIVGMGKRVPYAAKRLLRSASVVRLA